MKFDLPSFRIDDRVVLVTGATGYIGRALALAVAAAGGIPVLNGRNVEKLNDLAKDLAGTKHEALCLPFDVGEPNACSKAIDELSHRLGRLDIIINNAYGGRPGGLDGATPDDFDIACRENIAGPFCLVRRALPLLTEAGRQNPGGASVINVASMYGMVSPDRRVYPDKGLSSPPYYGPAKAGLIQLTRYLAAYFGEQNIRVNSVSPGPFPKAAITSNSPELHAALCEKVPLGRVGQVGELIGPVMFLASDASSYVTGINIPVDGGWTAW